MAEIKVDDKLYDIEVSGEVVTVRSLSSGRALKSGGALFNRVIHGARLLAVSYAGVGECREELVPLIRVVGASEIDPGDLPGRMSDPWFRNSYITQGGVRDGFVLVTMRRPGGVSRYVFDPSGRVAIDIGEGRRAGSCVVDRCASTFRLFRVNKVARGEGDVVFFIPDGR